MSGPTRDSMRQSIADRLLTSLEALVRRHRALGLRAPRPAPGVAGDAAESPESVLHAELIAAEVAHELAVARSALRRRPPMR